MATVPYSMGIFETIVDVHFGGGLAVEFFQDPFSYIELTHGAPNTKKGVISQWFRVPGSAIAAAKAEWQYHLDNDTPLTPMLGLVPIMIFGPPTLKRNWTSSAVDVGGYDSQNYSVSADPITHDPVYSPIGDPTFVVGHTADYSFDGTTSPQDPSYIAVDCRGKYPALSVNIVMPSDNLAEMDGGGLYSIINNYSADDTGGLYTGLVLNCTAITGGPLSPAFTVTSVADHSAVGVTLGGYSEKFRLLPMRSEEFDLAPNFDGQRITPDHWHNITLSFDFTNKVSLVSGLVESSSEQDCDPLDGTCTDGTSSQTVVPGSVSSTCKLYIAFDDKNLTGNKLTVYRPSNGGPNDILPVNGYFQYKNNGFDSTDTSCIRFGRQQTTHQTAARATYEFTPGEVPFNEGPVAFPVSSLYTDSMKHVEMGEGQIFTGISGDTGKAKFRRLFVTDQGKPASMTAASKALKQDPAIRLHGSKNWIEAKNTGSFDVRTPGNSVGHIEKYTPDPSLTGKQGDPQ